VDCIFCRIARAEAEASIVFEGDLVLAFLDVRAFHPGHALVIPRRHVTDIYALDETALAGALLGAVALVARAVRDALAPDGVNVWQSTGSAAGQEVPHLHLHVMPRYEGDGLLRIYPARPEYPDRVELDAVAARLRAAMPS
jgi:histidine triad (HIT) family protein